MINGEGQLIGIRVRGGWQLGGCMTIFVSLELLGFGMGDVV